MLKEAELAIESNTRLRALWITAGCFRDHPGTNLLEQVWNQLEKESWDQLSIEDKAEYSLAKAFCLYHFGDKELSLTTIDNIIGLLESHGIANSVYLTLVAGRAVVHSSVGDYEGSVAISEGGIQAARKMGEERRVRLLAANLALSYSRLGNTEAQLRWANWAAEAPGSQEDVFAIQQIHSIRARGYALAGQAGDAITALEQARGNFDGPLPAHLSQSWNLRRADVFLLLGREVEAVTAARNAVTAEMSELFSDMFAGPYARWSARLAVAEGLDVSEVRMRLERLTSRQQALDRMDRAEVLNAKVWLDTRTGVVDEEERREMWVRLSELPGGATDELRRMGMLDL